MTRPRMHRDQVDAMLRDYGETARNDLPDKFRNPQTEDDFALGLLHALHATGHSVDTNGVGPRYDKDGFLTGISGIRMKGADE